MGLYGSTTIQSAPERNYAQETRDTLETQLNLAPRLYESESTYQPLYNQLQLGLTEAALFGGDGQRGLLSMYRDIYPQLGEMSAAANRQQREADISDVEALGGRASEAFLNANPNLRRALDEADALGGPQANTFMDRLASTIGTQPIREDVQVGELSSGRLGDLLYQQAMGAGPSALSQRLEQAASGLSTTGALTPEEERIATQQARAAYAARGLGLGPQAIAGEVQNRLINQRQRQMENLSAIGGINQQLMAEREANRAFSGNVQSQDLARRGQNISNRFAADVSNRDAAAAARQAFISNLGQAAQLRAGQLAADRAYAATRVGLRQGTASDPFMAILGRPSAAFSAGQGFAQQGMANTSAAGPALFNPESSYASNIYGGNQQAQSARNIAQAQTNASLFSGVLGSIGNIAGGYFGR